MWRSSSIKKRRASALLAALALAVSGVGVGAASAFAEPALNNDSPSDVSRTSDVSDCILSNEADGYGEGEVSATLREAEEELAAYVTDHPDTTTLLGFCTDRNGLLLTAPEITANIESAMASASRHLADDETIIAAVSAAARGPLQEAIDAVVQEDQPIAASMVDASVSRDGTIEVTVSAGTASHTVEALHAAFEASAPGAVIEVSITEEPTVEFTALG